ncbi:hypothetical protein OGAPHI_004913 [Ogataea philodendri]|uniref:Hydantoin racemase n=1 Tax=Ogataea philodendri TaxID=1378263 RepID=A0A9P8P1I8_9ASCO|nr:uncharacterized protein OGAPHI_004913 [Ogataea philodendri]KAH3663512.1 hypothetical protein OGAPHI_004913 [Ogataea philodendri]
MASDLNELPFVKGSGETTVKVLFLNPNATNSMTMSCLDMISNSIPADTIVYGYTGPENDTPITIEGHLDSVLSAASCIRNAYGLIDQVDAVVVGCFSVHPLINCVREEFSKPCCGIMEAGFYNARLLGGKFGVVCTVYRSQIRHEFAVRNYGLTPFCAGLLSTKLAVKELETKPREEVLALMANCALELVKKDADCIVLGCAGMADMANAVKAAVEPYHVQVIDGVSSAVNILSGLVRMGLRTSKRGLFMDSKPNRELRGQNYL